MANLVYDLVDPALLIDYVRAYDIEVLREDAQLSLGRFLPDRPTQDLDFRIRKGTLNDVDAAEYRAWDTPAKMTGRPGVSFIRGSLGPVSRQIPLGEEEYLRQQQLDRGTNDPIIQAIYDDAERMIRAVQVRIELAKGDIINDGTVNIAENGLALEADYGRDAAMSTVVGVFWTSAAAPILTDLLASVEAYVEQNGIEPGEILMSRSRLANLALNTEIRQYAAANGTTPTRVNMTTVADVFAAEGLPPITLYDTQVRVDGVKTRVLPVNKIFLMPPAGERYGDTFYGVTAEAQKLRAKGLIVRDAAPGLVAVVTETDHPVQTYTVGTGIALPATPNPNLVMDIQVAA